MIVGPQHGCGGLLNLTESGSLPLSSPDVNSDGVYEPDLDCVWTIIATGNSIVNLQFNSFVLHGEAPACPDYVEVRIVWEVLRCTLQYVTSYTNP